MRRLGVLGLMALPVALLVSCADILGVDEVEIGTADAAATTTGVGGNGGTATTNVGTAGGAQVGGGGSGGEGLGGGETGGGGNTGDEDCLNGSDDDGDGLVDCEDDDCGFHTCVPATPSGWLGPFVVSEDATPPDCPGSWPDEAMLALSGQLDAPVANCSACACDAPAGGTCSTPTYRVWQNNNCTGSNGLYLPITPGLCEEMNPISGTETSVRVVTAAQASGGSCNASGGTPTLPPADFDARTRVCGGSDEGGGCGNDVCLPLPAAFEQVVCVMAVGDIPCPNSFYADRRVVYTGLDDSRDCTGCSCGAASGQSCDGQLTTYDDPNCTGFSLVVPNDGTCVNTQADFDTANFDYEPPTGGSCPPAGGQPIGDVDPTGATTLCCSS